MRQNANTSIIKQIAVLIFGIVLAAACRDPEFEEAPWRAGGFDPGEPGAGPAPLCPAGSTAPINNSLSPYIGGDVHPDLVVEVFSYFRCKNCAHLADMMHEIWHRRTDYQETVRFYYHHFPLYGHKTDMQLHAATVAAQEQSMDAFWQMHDFMFAGINADPPILYDAAELREFAQNVLQLDMVKYDQTANSDETMQQIAWDKEQGVNLGMIGTPGIYLCGEAMLEWKMHVEENIDNLLLR